MTHTIIAYSNAIGGGVFFFLLILILGLGALGGIIYAIGSSVLFVVNAIRRIKYKSRLTKELPKLEGLTEEINNLFLPSRKATQEEIDTFVSTNSETISRVNGLFNEERVFKDILDERGITAFRDAVDSMPTKLAENNKIYDIVDLWKQMSEIAMRAYNRLVDGSDYFTYSEMQEYEKTVIDKDCLKVIEEKYLDYITDDTSKQFLEVIKNLQINRESYNKAFIRSELEENKSFFNTVLGQYPLDPQQRDSIVKLEDNCLVIASAGSGKTSTILGKAKYLVEKRNIDPSKILLITYTRKAANELHERMRIEGMTCSTFHALAYQIIAQVTGQAPSISEASVSLNVFQKLIKDNKDFLHAINNYIINQQSLMRLEHEYRDAFTYFEDRKKYGIQALFPDVDGRIIFTRSEEEKRLVSILTRLGVPFRYENAYQVNTTTPERRQYRPDFTIYYQNSQGQWQWLYLEHFAIDYLGNVPRWFGEGTKGGWKAANKKYKEGISWKRNIHRQYGTTLIETTSADFALGTGVVEMKLRMELAKYGVPIKERADEELYELLVKRNRKLEKSVYTLILSFITLMKANEKTIDQLLEGIAQRRAEHPAGEIPSVRDFQDFRNEAILKDIIKPFYEEYERELDARGEIDFTDAIIQATELCRKGLWRHYEYILVDEFQDISVDRYKLLQALRSDSPKTKLFCVGDDWQSIFRFAGSDMSLVYEFEKYFGFTEQCKIETTYRFHQPLIDKSSEFIMKNKEQKEKTIKTPDGDTYKTYLNFVKCDGEEEDGVKKEVEKIIADIPNNQSILLLGRYNYDAVSVGYNGKMDMTANRMTVNVGGREIPFLSVHSAKGLEADNVILVNCNQGAYGFPSLIEDDPILDFVLSKSEAYPFAEERRLFYVAMTRARMKMFVLYDQKKPSPFIGEFLLRIERGSYLCPRCLEGKMVAIKDGQTTNGEKYRSFVCSNNESGCDFFETKYGDLTPPGILITEEMTAQDIEKLREERRNRRVRGVSPPSPNNAYTTPFPPPIVETPHEDSEDDLPF